jgi:hydroxymethylbilane synthase
VKLATRGSALALWQANHVADLLRARDPGLNVEIVVVKTTGDVRQDVPLQAVAGKGVFVREIEQALLAGAADIAVHSCKDLQSDDPPGLTLAAFCERADARDCLVSPKFGTLDNLPHGALVGTGAPRRIAQLLHRRPDLRFTEIRGNVDTRLAKLARGDCDALVLAVAGLERLNRAEVITERLSTEEFVPQVGQACVAVQCRESDEQTVNTVHGACDNARTRREVTAERAFLSLLGGGCTAPVAAHGIGGGHDLYLDAVVARRDGSVLLRTRTHGFFRDAATDLARRAFDDLVAQGARKLLDTESLVTSEPPAL